MLARTLLNQQRTVTLRRKRWILTTHRQYARQCRALKGARVPAKARIPRFLPYNGYVSRDGAYFGNWVSETTRSSFLMDMHYRIERAGQFHSQAPIDIIHSAMKADGY